MRRLPVLALCWSSFAVAALDRLEVVERSAVLDGRSFGAAGAYERLTGRAHFLVDPLAPANRRIQDLALAPRNRDGLVGFSADFHLLRPREAAKGNGTLLLDIVNRGNKLMLTTFCFAPRSNDPRTREQFGDALLLEQGYTLAWIGWQFDVPSPPDLMRVYAPKLAGGLRGPVRAEFIPEKKTSTLPLAERSHQPYAVADPPEGTLYVRDSHDGARRTIARSEWRFNGDGTVTLDGAGFEPGRIYELVYIAADPSVTGVGFAAVRDFVSHLKYGSKEVKRSLGFGISQSGRFLRALVYEGFNADEKGRQVFDALWPHVAGAGRGSFNFRFAQPSRDAQPYGNFFYPTDVPPFTDDALLAEAARQGVVPKIFYTNGSYEYWGRAASLIHTTPDGSAEVSPAAATRIYFIAGAQHGPGEFPPVRGGARHRENPLDPRYVLRGLLVRMQRWMTEGTSPPPSVYPKLDRLSTPAGLGFPRADAPARAHTAWRVEYGTEPPAVGSPYAALVPKVGADGNEIAGIRLPEIAVPLAAYTGWNFRTAEMGAPGELVAFTGSWFPFTPKEIAARYRDKRDYLEQSEAAARRLASEGYVLTRDVPALAARSARIWDYMQAVQ